MVNLARKVFLSFALSAEILADKKDPPVLRMIFHRKQIFFPFFSDRNRIFDETAQSYRI